MQLLSWLGVSNSHFFIMIDSSLVKKYQQFLFMDTLCSLIFFVEIKISPFYLLLTLFHL